MIPVAEEAIEGGSAEALARMLTDDVQSNLKKRFQRVMELKEQASVGIEEPTAYVEAMLGFVVNANTLYECAKTDVHTGT